MWSGMGVEIFYSLIGDEVIISIINYFIRFIIRGLK